MKNRELNNRVTRARKWKVKGGEGRKIVPVGKRRRGRQGLTRGHLEKKGGGVKVKNFTVPERRWYRFRGQAKEVGKRAAAGSPCTCE